MADPKPRRPSEAASSSAAAEEKKAQEEKRYPIIPRDSIKLIGEQVAIGEIPDSVTAALSEDVSYRIREVIMKASQPMKHSHRKQLTTEDINKALKMMNVPPILGYGAPEPMAFRQTKEGEIFFTEDNEVDLFEAATANITPSVLEKPTVKGSWIAIEGMPTSSKGTSCEGSKAPSKQMLSEDYKEYYTAITKALLGPDDDCKKFALNDLRTNTNISPLVPYFTNFVCSGVKTINHDVSQLTTLLQTIRALVNNDSVFIFPAVKPMVEALLYCALEPLAVFINPHNDHWVVRDIATRILANIINRLDTPHISIRASTLKTFTEVIQDQSRPLCAHYGAIMGLLALGCSVVEEVLLPRLSVYMPHLEAVMEDTSYSNRLLRSDAFKVHGAMQMAAEFMLRNRLEIFKRKHISKESDAESSDDEDAALVLPPISYQQPADHHWGDNTAEPMETDADGMPILAPASAVGAGENGDAPDRRKDSLSDMEVYMELSWFFGDSLCMRLPELGNLTGVFLPTPKEDMVILGDADSNKTGDELLAEFMEQVRIQEAAEAAQREQEAEMRRRQEEKERLLRIQQEQERLAQEQKAREEEERRRLQELEMRRLESSRSRRRESRQSQQYSSSVSEPSAGASTSSSRHGGHLQSYYRAKDSKPDDDDDEEEEEEEEEEEGQQHDLVASQVTETRLKIKIKQPRHPRIKVHLNRVGGWGESSGQQHSRAERHRSETRELREDKHHEYRDSRESRDVYDYERREHRESKHKRKRHSPKSHDPFDFEKSDTDEHHSKKVKSMSQIYSPAGESSESDSTPHSRLKIKLKVPNKDSPKE